MAQRQNKFVVQKSEDGKFYGTLVGRNGEVLSTTETMESKQALVVNLKAQRQALASVRAITDLTDALEPKLTEVEFLEEDVKSEEAVEETVVEETPVKENFIEKVKNAAKSGKNKKK